MFRPIYYLGCKATLSSAIRQAIDEVDPTHGHACDLFAGTGVVSAALSRERRVTAVDIQEYSRVIASAMLNPATFTAGSVKASVRKIEDSEVLEEVLACTAPLVEHERTCINEALAGRPSQLIALLESPPLIAQSFVDEGAVPAELSDVRSKAIQELTKRGLVDARSTTVLRNFGGVYFSYRQAAVLDAALEIADSQPEERRDSLKAAVLSTASQLVNTVGKQFAQPIRPRDKRGRIKPSLIAMVQRDRSIDTLHSYWSWLARYAALPPATTARTALRLDYSEALATHGETFSVVYADPPYTRDHYSRFYHVLETMCLRDSPVVTQVMHRGKRTVSRGAYRSDRHQSAFCIRSSAPDAFRKLFEGTSAHGLPLVLSYSPHEAHDGTHPRVLPMASIVDIAQAHYMRVEVSRIEGTVHNKLNRSDLELATREHAEVIVKCYV